MAAQAGGGDARRDGGVTLTIDQVCQEYGVTRAQLVGRSLDSDLTNARRAAIRRLHAAGNSLGTIGRLLRRDPTTIGYHLRRAGKGPWGIVQMTTVNGAIGAGSRIVYQGGGEGLVEAVETLDRWAVLRVRLPDGSTEIVVQTPDGSAVAPVPLAAALRSGVRIHDLPVAVVEHVLAIAVLAMAGMIEGFEAPSKAPETSVERGS